MRALGLVLTFFCAVASFAHPGSAIAVSADGRVYFVDTGAGVFSIDAKGQLVREPGPAFHWFAFDPRRRFAGTRWPSLPGAEFRSAGSLILSSDYPVAIGSDGKFYFPEPAGGERVRVVGLEPSGARTVRATVALPWLNGLAAGPNGTLYYTEDDAVRKLDARGRISTVAANVCKGSNLRGLALAADGSLYVAASGCAAVVRVDAKGKVSTVLRASPPWAPTAVAVAGRDVYVLEYLHTPGDDRREWLPRVRKIASNGAVSTLAASTHTRQ